MKDWRLWGILVIAMAARVGLMTPQVRDQDRLRFLAYAPDSGAYWELSASLLAEHSFENSTPSIEIFRTPGYPVFLTPVKKFSRMPGIRDDEIAVSVQILIDLHLVFLTFLLGRWVLSHRAGLLAALFQAIAPMAVAAPCRILSDSLFAFLLTAAVLLFVRHLKTSGWPSLLASAGVLGLACYVRPIGLPMAGVFGLALLVERSRAWRRLANAGAFAGVVAMLIAPWVARNIVVADFYGFSSVQAEGMYFYTAAETLAAKEGKPVEEVRKDLRDQASQEFDRNCQYPPLTPGHHARYMQARAWEVFRENPGTFVWVHLKGCMAFWLPGATEVLEVAGATTGQKGTLDVLHREGLLAAARHYFGGDTRAMLAAGALSAIDAVRYLGVLLLGVAWVRRRNCGLRNADCGFTGTRTSGATETLVLSGKATEETEKSSDGKSAIRIPRSAILPVLILFLGLVLVSLLLPGPASHPRFRVPVEPLLSIAAAAGWLATFRKSQDARDARD